MPWDYGAQTSGDCDHQQCQSRVSREFTEGQTELPFDLIHLQAYSQCKLVNGASGLRTLIAELPIKTSWIAHNDDMSPVQIKEGHYTTMYVSTLHTTHTCAMEQCIRLPPSRQCTPPAASYGKESIWDSGSPGVVLPAGVIRWSGSIKWRCDVSGGVNWLEHSQDFTGVASLTIPSAGPEWLRLVCIVDPGLLSMLCYVTFKSFL